MLREYFQERRTRNQSEFRTLSQCWRLATRGLEVQFLDGRRMGLETNLGRKVGRRVFMEEIIHRYYFGIVQGLVYGGAVAVMVTVALYLLWSISVVVPVAAFTLEVLALLLYAIVVAYSPVEVVSGRLDSNDQVLLSLHNAVAEMTTAVSDLTRLLSQTDVRQEVVLSRLVDRQDRFMAQGMKGVIDAMADTSEQLRRLLNFLSAGSEEERRRKDLLDFLTARPGEEEAGAGGLA